MTAGIFLLFRNIHANRSNSRVWKLIDDVSRMSYGIYLAHIIVLNAVHGYLAPMIANPFLRIPTIALITFAITYLGVKLISLLPGANTLWGKGFTHRWRGHLKMQIPRHVLHAGGSLRRF